MTIPEHIREEAEACYLHCEQMDSYGIIETIATALLAAEQRGMERAEDKHAVLKSAAVELACSYQDWADMYYGIARECGDLETQETAAECSRDARKYLFAIIGDGTVEEHAAIRKAREERG